MRAIVTLVIVVLVGLLLECGLLYVQARDGRRLPFGARIFPRFDLGGQDT